MHGFGDSKGSPSKAPSPHPGYRCQLGSAPHPTLLPPPPTPISKPSALSAGQNGRSDYTSEIKRAQQVRKKTWWEGDEPVDPPHTIVRLHGALSVPKYNCVVFEQNYLHSIIFHLFYALSEGRGPVCDEKKNRDQHKNEHGRRAGLQSGLWHAF